MQKNNNDFIFHFSNLLDEAPGPPGKTQRTQRG